MTNVQVPEGEAWAFARAIQFVQSLNLSNVIFEMDCRGVVDRIRSSTKEALEPGKLIQYWRNLLALNTAYLIGFIKRQVNDVVYKLVREEPILLKKRENYNNNILWSYLILFHFEVQVDSNSNSCLIKVNAVLHISTTCWYIYE